MSREDTKMASSSEIDEFMQGPLVTWLRSCLNNEEKLLSYDDLIDGTLIHQVFLLIDPEPVYHGVTPNARNSHVRVRNMSCIVKNIKVLYEDELEQVIVSLPDFVRLGQFPESKEGLEDMRLLLLLLLGCAVQCPNKHKFIDKIKSLSIECQHTLVHCIQQVTDSQSIVLTNDNSEVLTTDLLLKHIKRVLLERDHYFQLWLSAYDEKRLNISQNSVSIAGASNESQCHLAGELAEWKTKLRRMRQELEEKSEALSEARDELERENAIIAKLKSEIQELKQEARVGKAYRDEADALREKAERCDRLDTEIIKYKEKLGDLDYYKGRVEELRQDNRVLEETKEMIEEQLTKMKKRADYAVQLESQFLQLKKTIVELTLERDSIQEKLSDLVEENTQLQLQNKSTLSSNHSASKDEVFSHIASGFGSSNLSEQLCSNAQTRVLKLELENKRLVSELENIHDNLSLSRNERILELEREKKRLSLLVDNLEDCKRKYGQQIAELESNLEETRAQLRRVQESYQMSQEQLELRCDDAEYSNKEKIRLKDQITEMSMEIDTLKQKADNAGLVPDLKQKMSSLEKELSKYKRIAEEGNINVDKLIAENSALEKQREQLIKQTEDLHLHINKLNDIEKKCQELHKQNKMDMVTIANLKNDLVAEKLKIQTFKDSFDSLGLAIDNVTDPDEVLNSIASNPEVLKAVRERLDREDSNPVNEMSLLSNAKLQVNIITLQSQISSLTSQHTALQLANSQLVAEKEEALKELNKLKADREILQTLHEQLISDYDNLNKEKESLKNNLKDVKTEKRNLMEKLTQMETLLNNLEMEKENWQQDSQLLVNLTAEHSKLKDDFRSLFQSNEKVKKEYHNVQEEYKKVRAEAGKLKVTVTELRGDLSNKSEKISTLNLEFDKLSNKCEMLLHANSTLEDDRRSLMDQVSSILSQYHELLSHALEDKEYYHHEEKIFVDKLNDVMRQKEKLEEKIIESYRKLDNSSSKKRGFGASFVRRVKKAGSDFINKNKKSVHEESFDKRATESDTSIDEDPSKSSAVQDVEENLSCLSIPGTRKTVYLSCNESVDGGDTSGNISNNGRDELASHSTADQARTSTPLQESRPPLLVYNRLTAKVGSSRVTSSPSPTPSHQSNKDNSQSVDNVKNSVWYEYGCV